MARGNYWAAAYSNLYTNNMCVQAWFDAKVVTDEIKIAHDAASIKAFVITVHSR